MGGLAGRRGFGAGFWTPKRDPTGIQARRFGARYVAAARLSVLGAGRRPAAPIAHKGKIERVVWTCNKCQQPTTRFTCSFPAPPPPARCAELLREWPAVRGAGGPMLRALPALLTLPKLLPGARGAAGNGLKSPSLYQYLQPGPEARAELGGSSEGHSWVGVASWMVAGAGSRAQLGPFWGTPGARPAGHPRWAPSSARSSCRASGAAQCPRPPADGARLQHSATQPAGPRQTLGQLAAGSLANSLCRQALRRLKVICPADPQVAAGVLPPQGAAQLAQRGPGPAGWQKGGRRAEYRSLDYNYKI